MASPPHAAVCRLTSTTRLNPHRPANPATRSYPGLSLPAASSVAPLSSVSALPSSALARTSFSLSPPLCPSVTFNSSLNGLAPVSGDFKRNPGRSLRRVHVARAEGGRGAVSVTTTVADIQAEIAELEDELETTFGRVEAAWRRYHRLRAALERLDEAAARERGRAAGQRGGRATAAGANSSGSGDGGGAVLSTLERLGVERQRVLHALTRAEALAGVLERLVRSLAQAIAMRERRLLGSASVTRTPSTAALQRPRLPAARGSSKWSAAARGRGQGSEAQQRQQRAQGRRERILGMYLGEVQGLQEEVQRKVALLEEVLLAREGEARRDERFEARPRGSGSAGREAAGQAVGSGERRWSDAVSGAREVGHGDGGENKGQQSKADGQNGVDQGGWGSSGEEGTGEERVKLQQARQLLVQLQALEKSLHSKLGR